MNIVLVGFAAGIWLCQQQERLMSWSAMSIGALGLALTCLLAHRHCRAALLPALLMAGVMSGLAYGTWRAEVRLADRLAEALEGQDITIIGVARDLPQHSALGLRFQLDVERAPVGVPGRVVLWWYRQDKTAPNAVPAVRAGERWRLRVRLRQPHGNMNPHGFDYEAWLFERGIGALGYVRSDPENRSLAQRAGGPGSWIDAQRERIREHIERVLPDSAWRGILVALVVGDQASISRAQWTLFSRTGVTHLMSISGLHVTLIGTLAGFGVALLWRRSEWLTLRVPVRKASLLSGTLAAGFYVLLAGSGVPAQRTLYMLAVAALALWLGRGGEALRTLLLALATVLLIDPWAVLSAGFWLSFGAVGALLLVSASSGHKEHWLRSWFKAQWAVTVLTLPILLGLFQQFSLVSPLANAIAIPAVSALIAPLALLFAVMPLPSLVELANCLLGWLMHFLEWCAALPAANWQQAAPPWWMVGACVLGALWSLLPRGTPGRWTSLLVFVPLIAWSPERPAPGAMAVTVLDVGQGLAVHVRTAHHDLLYDAGPQYGSESDSGERIVVPYLRASGVSRLDAVVISHDDVDHRGGADSVFAALPVATWFSSLPSAHPLRGRGIAHRACARGQSWVWDGVRFEFLHPAAAQAAGGADNDASCVLRVASAYGSVLLPGDIERRAEGLLLSDTGVDLHADVLVAPHHGSKSSSHADFVAAAGASSVVFTAGYRNRFHHPASAVVERYAATGAQLLRSDGDGAVRFDIDAHGITSTSTRALARRYWHDQSF